MASNQFNDFKRDLAKETGKTLAFFFIGVPAFLFVIAWLLVS